MTDKFTLGTWLYSFGFVLLMFFQQTYNYLNDLPDTTLAGIGMLMAGIGGLASFFSEVKRNGKERSKLSIKMLLISNLAFAAFVATLFGLLTYKTLVISNQMPGAWFGLLLACGFSNQVLLKVIEKATTTQAEKILSITVPPNEKEK